MSETEGLQKRFEAALMPNYGLPPVALARGEGCRVWDVDGKEYLDLFAGIAVSALGHAHPAIVNAVTAQVSRIAHTSNHYLHEPEVALAERLLGLLNTDGRVFFANSGAEANEAAIKMVRRRQGSGRPVVVAANGGFHGRTMGSLAITGKASIREPFGPFGLTRRFVPYGDEAALRAAVTADCAAVFLEPCLGEGGVIPAPEGYLRAAREACDAVGAMLVVDEVQSGIGRTGAWFAHQREGVVPDVLTLAKGLGGGLPIGACVGFGSCGAVFVKGDHGSTFGANPVSCAAALAVLDTIENEDLLANAERVGKRLADGMAAYSADSAGSSSGASTPHVPLASGASTPHPPLTSGASTPCPLLKGVRGSGLWLAAVLSDDSAPRVEAAARQAGFLVNAVQPDAVRLAPPLILDAAGADEFLAAFPAILDAAAGHGTT